MKIDSYINYVSDVVSIEYIHSSNILNISWINQLKFENSKIAYIPAERNIVAAIPNWFEVKLLENNTLSYMRDWGESRQNHTKENPFKIPGIDASYFFEGGNDYVITNDNKTLLLTNTSSGYQSIIPLNVLLNYFTSWIYSHDVPKSVDTENRFNNLNSILSEKIIWNNVNIDRDDYESVNIFLKEFTKPEFSKWVDLRNNWINTWKNFNNYCCSNLFIEEPEQNLFPSTQMALVYNILEQVNDNDKNHKLFLTTHSPYVLYAINNCILGGLVEHNIPDELLPKISFRRSFTNPKNVSVWELKEGKFNTYNGSDTIQDNDGLIRENYFDGVMNNLMGDFNFLLNFHD